MRASSDFRVPRLDKKGNLKRINAETRQHFYAMLAAFLRAVIPQVPVWTGMARASLIPLAKYLTNRAGFTVSVPITPAVGSERHRQAGQNAAAGEALGTFQFSTTEGVYNMDMSIKVPHYEINEFSPGLPHLRHPGPWHSLQAGKEAALEYREYVKKHLPRIRLSVIRIAKRG